MTPQRWQLLQELFDRGVPLDHDARLRMLLAECGDDAQLRDQVLSMLRAHDGATQFERQVEEAIGATLRIESAPGKGYMCAVPLCDSATCVTNMLDTGSFDVLGRPWPSPWALGGSEPKCHICGNATDLEVLLGQKVAGEK